MLFIKDKHKTEQNNRTDWDWEHFHRRMIIFKIVINTVTSYNSCSGIFVIFVNDIILL